MRMSVPITLPAAVFSAIRSAKSHVRRLDTSRGHSALAIVGWAIVGVCPLASFDAGGGQTAVDVARYVVFRGLDRDVWYALSAVSMFLGLLAALSILIGLMLQSTGLIYRDRTLVLWGSGIILPGLLAVTVATEPVAALSIFGAAALPHIGWWLTLIYTLLTLHIVCGWISEQPAGGTI